MVFVVDGGKVAKRLVDVGARVKKDQPLAELDPEDVRLQLEATRAQVAAAEANLQLARAERDRYKTLLERMRAAERRIEPVLSVLRDQVLFLKHNLNARAISALQGEYRTLQGNVDQLLRDMQRAIDEADTFVRNLQQNS